MFSVVAEAVKPLYGWSDGIIALLSFWGPAGFCVALWPSSWLLDVRGLRSALIAGTGIVLAGCGILCIP